MSPHSSPSEEPLLENDSPSRLEGESPKTEGSGKEASEEPPPDGYSSAQHRGRDNSPSETRPQGGHEGSGGEPSRGDLLAYLIENRAAIDVLFEMMAIDRADGEEEEYRRCLEALQDRHKLAVRSYREALNEDLPETSLEAGPPSANAS